MSKKWVLAMPSMDLLIYSLTRVEEIIAKLQHQYNAFDENEANARYTLLYVNASIWFYKLNPHLIPESEFDQLIESIEQLPHDHTLLNEMLSSLIFIHDLLNERQPDKERQQKIDKALQNISTDVFKEIHASSSSFTANYIYSNLAKPIQLIDSSLLHKENIMEVFTKAVEEKKRYKDDKLGDQLVDALTKLLELNNKISSEQQIELLEKWIVGYGLKQFTEKELSRILHALLNHSEDKESFVKDFLTAYLKSYDGFPRKSEGKNILLEGISLIFPLLDNSLPPKRFLQLLSEVGFDLKDPRASENDDAFGEYMFFMSFYKDSTEIEADSSYDNVTLRFVFKNKKLYYLFQLLGRNAVPDIQLFESKILRQLPIFTQSDLFSQYKHLENELVKFISLFIKVNENAPTHQQRNILLYFTKYHNTIKQIIKIMGAEGIRYMQNHLAGTVIHLERTLESMPILPNDLQQFLAIYFQQSHLSIKEHPEEIRAFITCITAIAALITVAKDPFYYEDESQYDKPQFYLDKSKEKTPKEFLFLLAEILLKEILNEKGADLNQEDITCIFKRIEPARFAQLAAASQRMANDEYRDVYLSLLRLDLTEGNVDNFLHNTEQEDPLGSSLARHNQKIRKKLEKKGISPKTALHYDKTYDFIILPGGNANLSQGNALVVLWTYLNQLKEEAQNDLASKKISNNKNRERLQAIIKYIEQLQKLILAESSSSTKVIAEGMAKPNAKALVKKIITNIHALAQHSAENSTSFHEFAQHTVDQTVLIDNLEQKKSTGSINKLNLHHFSVEQWPKEKLMTFFLGDEVGCCLATTNSQFQAMVQRRMDDALLFHVAVDKTTNRPAALIWLYLAETEDGKIVLVANFFEVNTKYAVNDMVRRGLLNGLLQFTQQYLQENPGIEAFYMNKLSYGWNIRDLDRYPVVDVNLVDKLGGPYIPGFEGEELGIDKNERLTLTDQKYYLVSLKQSQFHQLDLQVLAEDSESTLIEKNRILQKAILALSEKEMDLDKLKEAISTQYSLELAPFYHYPIVKDPRFAKDVDIALQSVSEKAESKEKVAIPAPMFFSQPPEKKKENSSEYNHKKVL
ncbi:hypothetical protein E3983_03855 [Legionella israelensis]|uniref:Dot/Icm T4SS effector n=1 Tax=Legionella israelensis TaxID=454 RepID=A0AAX1EEN0_9GAMM|nr:hypothetical protein [Legionella israelensis]QBR83566.1 hypothetical protein E3983_03855 [Legionella israelensis]